MKTIKGIVEGWWVDYKDTVLDTTCIHRRQLIDVHILPKIGDLPLDQVNHSTLQDFLRAKRQCGTAKFSPHGLADSTLFMMCRILRMVCRWAVEHGHLMDNPAKQISCPRGRAKEVITYKPNEVQKLITVARPKWFGDVIDIAYRTGLRRGEIYGLQWDDIDFDNHFLTVRRTVSATKPGERLVHQPKTIKSRRRVELDNQTMEIFHRRRAAAQSEWVIENQYGNSISPWYTVKYIHDACKRAGIPRRSFHALRHTHATVLLSKGVHVKIVQERLGHSKIEMTLNTYSHVLPTMQAAAVSVFNQL